MRKRLLTLVTTVALAAVVTAAAAPAAVVELQVDSAVGPTTLFDGAVATEPHPVDGGDGSGAHQCSGPAGAPPGATATGALDDALRAAGIAWRGYWDPSFHDFFIDSIGPFASQALDTYWSLTVNGRFSAGGCLAQVRDGDAVHFSYGPLFGGGGTVGPPGDGGGSGAAGGRADGAGAGSAPSASPAKARALARRAVGFLQRRPNGAGAEWSRLALAVRAQRGVAAAITALFGGASLPPLDADGSLRQDVNATALAALALRCADPAAARRAGHWLASVQDPAGGFPYRAGTDPDVDTTGLASWALASAGRLGLARRGASFVRAAGAAGGGLPSLPGGDPNAQSTGLGLVALRVAGLGPRAGASPTPLDYLASLARRNGSIAYSATASPTPVWTTAQALLGLTGRARLLGPPCG